MHQVATSVADYKAVKWEEDSGADYEWEEEELQDLAKDEQQPSMNKFAGTVL